MRVQHRKNAKKSKDTVVFDIYLQECVGERRELTVSGRSQKSDGNTQYSHSRRSSTKSVLIRQLLAAERPVPNQKDGARKNGALMRVDRRYVAQKI